MATDHELELYVMTGCPYCIKVKRFLADNGLAIPERNISTDSDAEQTLIAVGGKRQVPCLFIDGTRSTSRATLSRGYRRICSSTQLQSARPDVQAHTTQTCTPASKVDIFRHLWMLAYSFLQGSGTGDPFFSVPKGSFSRKSGQWAQAAARERHGRQRHGIHRPFWSCVRACER